MPTAKIELGPLARASGRCCWIAKGGLPMAVAGSSKVLKEND
jgi:hypothetical protein